MRSSLSAVVLIAFCVGAIVLSACAAPFSTDNQVNFNAIPLPPSSTYSSDYAVFSELLDLNGLAGINGALQLAFESFIKENGPTQSDDTSDYFTFSCSNDIEVSMSIELPVAQPAGMMEWYAAALDDVNGAANYLANSISFSLQAVDAIELCIQMVYDDNPPVPWAVGVFQLGWNGITYQNVGNSLVAKMLACNSTFNEF